MKCNEPLPRRMNEPAADYIRRANNFWNRRRTTRFWPSDDPNDEGPAWVPSGAGSASVCFAKRG
jgi:hypothetical protein